jgi:hypothetical protein
MTRDAKHVLGGHGCAFKRSAITSARGESRLTPCALDARDSAAFSSSFLASSFLCSQTLSTPAPAPVTQTVQIVEYLQIASQSKYSNNDIKARIEAESAPTYGTNMALWIPDFEYAHQFLLESTALHISTNAKGVELGAGSERVSKLLLETFPNLQLTLVDLSTNML